jgi:hypothetical protein
MCAGHFWPVPFLFVPIVGGHCSNNAFMIRVTGFVDFMDQRTAELVKSAYHGWSGFGQPLHVDYSYSTVASYNPVDSSNKRGRDDYGQWEWMFLAAVAVSCCCCVNHTHTCGLHIILLLGTDQEIY